LARGETPEPPHPGAPEPLRVIAEGYCAQGGAGRMGGGPEILAAVKPGSFELYRRGRLYGAPRIVRVTIHPDGKIELEDPVEAARSRVASAAW